MTIPNAVGVAAATSQPLDIFENRILSVSGSGYLGDLRVAGRTRHFLRDREIYSEGDAADYVFKVETGVVRSYTVLRDGRRQIDAFHGPGGVFGLEHGTAYRLSAAAASDCVLISYRRCNLEKLAAHNEQVSLQLFSSLLCSLAHAQEHAISLGRRSAIEKVAIFIIGYAKPATGGNDILLAMSRKDIADYLGLTIETVSRAFAHLEHGAFIELRGTRQVSIVDMVGLRGLCA